MNRRDREQPLLSRREMLRSTVIGGILLATGQVAGEKLSAITTLQMKGLNELLRPPSQPRVKKLQEVSDQKAADLGHHVDGLADFNFGLLKDPQGHPVMKGRRPNHDVLPAVDNRAGQARLVESRKVVKVEGTDTGVVAEPGVEAGLLMTRDELKDLIDQRKTEIAGLRGRGEIAKRKVKLVDLSVQKLPEMPTRQYSDTLISELTEPVVTKVNAQKINAVIANREQIGPETTANVWFGLFGNKVNEGASLLRVAEIAHQNPASAIFGFDVPAHGDSDGLTRRQKKDLKAGNFESVVEPCLQVLAEKGVKKVRLFGSSLGGAIALTAGAIAKERFDIDVEVVGVYGIPIKEAAQEAGMQPQEGKSIQERALAALYGDEAAKLMTLDMEDAASLDLYHSHAFDPRLMAMEGMDKSKAAQLAHVANYMASNVLKDVGMHYARGLAQLTKENLVKLGVQFAEANENGNMYFHTGSKDKVSPTALVSEVVDGIRAADESNKRRVTQQIRSGEGHLSLVQPIELGADVARNSLPLAA